MAIYGRTGQKVVILRKAVSLDVLELDLRKPDKHDRERIKLGMYLVVDDHGTKRLYDYVYLRADGACQEIDAAIVAAERLEFDRWAHRRLTELVTAGAEDLRTLRNRFGMSAQGKLIHASAITDEERKQTEALIKESR